MSSYKSLAFLTITLTILLGYNFMDAAWTDPTTTAPANNVEAPVNVGSTTQDKLGVLGVNGLSVFGQQTIASLVPTIKFEDTTPGAKDFWTQIDADRFYILADRNNAGLWDEPHPMMIYASTTADGDYAQFSNSVRATSYCSRNGQSCFEAGEVVSEIGEEDVLVSGAQTSALHNKAKGGSEEYDLMTNASCVRRGAGSVTDTYYLACPSGQYVAAITRQSATNGSPDILCCPFYPEASAGRKCLVEFTWQSHIAEYEGGPASVQTGSASVIMGGDDTDKFALGLYFEEDYKDREDGGSLPYSTHYVDRAGGSSTWDSGEQVDLGYFSVQDYIDKRSQIDALTNRDDSAYGNEYSKAEVRLTTGTTVKLANTMNFADANSAEPAVGQQWIQAKVVECNI